MDLTFKHASLSTGLKCPRSAFRICTRDGTSYFAVPLSYITSNLPIQTVSAIIPVGEGFDSLNLTFAFEAVNGIILLTTRTTEFEVLGELINANKGVRSEMNHGAGTHPHMHYHDDHASGQLQPLELKHLPLSHYGMPPVPRQHQHHQHHQHQQSSQEQDKGGESNQEEEATLHSNIDLQVVGGQGGVGGRQGRPQALLLQPQPHHMYGLYHDTMPLAHHAPLGNGKMETVGTPQGHMTGHSISHGGEDMRNHNFLPQPPRHLIPVGPGLGMPMPSAHMMQPHLQQGMLRMHDHMAPGLPDLLYKMETGDSHALALPPPAYGAASGKHEKPQSTQPHASPATGQGKEGDSSVAFDGLPGSVAPLPRGGPAPVPSGFEHAELASQLASLPLEAQGKGKATGENFGKVLTAPTPMAGSSSSTSRAKKSRHVEFGPVYTTENSNFQKPGHSRYFLFDEVYDYHTQGWYPARLKGVGSPAGKRRDFRVTASKYSVIQGTFFTFILGRHGRVPSEPSETHRSPRSTVKILPRKDEIPKILEQYHNHTHSGINKARELLSRSYKIEDFDRFYSETKQKCAQCNQSKDS